MKRLPLKLMIPIGVLALIITVTLQMTVLKGSQVGGGTRVAILIAFLLAVIVVFIQRIIARKKD